MKKSQLNLVLAGALAVAGALTLPRVYEEARHRTKDWAHIDLTAKERPFCLYEEYVGQEKPVKKLTVKRGEAVYVFNEWSAADGIRTTRFYINDILRSESQKTLNNRNLPEYIAGIRNGWELRTTEEGFRLGENVIKVETEDAQGKKTSDVAKVILIE